jgi:hypothetical protein
MANLHCNIQIPGLTLDSRQRRKNSVPIGRKTWVCVYLGVHVTHRSGLLRKTTPQKAV